MSKRNEPKRTCIIKGSLVAGSNRMEGIRSATESIKPGSRLALQRDRGNFFDPWAVKVLAAEGSQIGFVSCEHNELVSRLVGDGWDLEAIVSASDEENNWIRIEMDVFLNE